MTLLVARASEFNLASSAELDTPNSEQEHPWAHFVAQTRLSPMTGLRTFNLVGYEPSSMEWPKPSKNSVHQLNLYDYYQSYVLVCPSCSSAWCHSLCDTSRSRLWSIRVRWCAECLQGYVAHQREIHEGRMVVSCHCPGTILSFDDRLLGEGADHDTWESCFWALPTALRDREFLLWCQFDALCNPSTEPT